MIRVYLKKRDIYQKSNLKYKMSVFDIAFELMRKKKYYEIF